eukprot:gene29585-38706_t
MPSYFRFQAIVGSLIVVTLLFCDAGTKSRPHSHKGILPPFTGDHIAYNISADQNKKLKAGEPVIINQRNGKSGGAIVLQDVNAPPNLCMDRIRDLGFYHKVLPSDDNVGHWQVMPHPTKEGWSRVLYSCRLKLPNWIPDLVVSFLLKSAAIEATTWVKVESEKVFKQGKLGSVYEGVKQPNLAPCYEEFADESAAYDNSCASITETVEDASADTAAATTEADPSIENGEGEQGVESVEPEAAESVQQEL